MNAANNISFNLAGAANTVTLGTGTLAGVYGNGNQVAAGIGDSVVIAGDGNNYSSVAGGTVNFSGQGNTAAVNDTTVTTADGNYIGVTGTPSNAAGLLSVLSRSPQIARAIDGVY